MIVLKVYSEAHLNLKSYRESRHLKKLLKVGDNRLLWHFREQFRFGHREILLHYAKLPLSKILLGYLQHGSATKFPWTWQNHYQTLTTKVPVYVWSDETVKIAKSMGSHHVKAIGAPWLYLDSLNLSQSSLTSISPLSGALFVPLKGGGYSARTSSYERIVRGYRSLLGDSYDRVLLYYTEFCDPEVRGYWLNYGFQPLCAGMAWGPDIESFWTYGCGRPSFLHNVFRILTESSEITCEGPSTLVHYAVDLGKKTRILNSEMRNIGLRLLSGYKGFNRNREIFNDFDGISRAMLGERFHEFDDETSKVELTSKHLGKRNLMSVDEARAELDWLTVDWLEEEDL